MDIELAVDAMELAPHIDHMVLFSGDGDFRSLVEAVQRRGVRVTVFRRSRRSRRWWPTNCAGRRTMFTDIVQLRPQIGRDPSDRPARDPVREPRGERQHTPQFLQPRRDAGAGRRRGRFRGLIGGQSAQFAVMAGKPPSRAAIARYARGSWHSARHGANASRLGSTRRCHRSAVDARLLIVGLAPGCAAPTAPGGHSPAITPAICSTRR